MGRPAPSYDTLKDEYTRLLADAVVSPQWAAEAERTAKCIIEARPTLAAVEAKTTVPWQVVGVIQAMEAGCKNGALRLDRHLHNGDSLAHKTVNEPKGRPPGEPPFDFVYSATDALAIDGLDQVTDWCPEKLCYFLEKYNGWGYRFYHPDVLTPYLFSGTNQYHRGKFVTDGSWSASAVSGQIGAVPIMKALMAMGAFEEVTPIAVVANEIDEPHPWPSAEVEKGDASQAEIAAEGSRSMSTLQWLKWKLGLGGGTWSVYELTYWFKGSEGILHDINKFIGDNAHLLIGAFLLSCLVLACAAGFYLAEAHRDGRYFPAKA